MIPTVRCSSGFTVVELPAEAHSQPVDAAGEEMDVWHGEVEIARGNSARPEQDHRPGSYRRQSLAVEVHLG